MKSKVDWMVAVLRRRRGADDLSTVASTPLLSPAGAAGEHLVDMQDPKAMQSSFRQQRLRSSVDSMKPLVLGYALFIIPNIMTRLVTDPTDVSHKLTNMNCPCYLTHTSPIPRISYSLGGCCSKLTGNPVGRPAGAPPARSLSVTDPLC